MTVAEYISLWRQHPGSRGCCFYCGIELVRGAKLAGGGLAPDSWTKDHLIPRYYDIKELRIVSCCYACNQKKKGQLLEQFRARHQEPFYVEKILDLPVSVIETPPHMPKKQGWGKKAAKGVKRNIRRIEQRIATGKVPAERIPRLLKSIERLQGQLLMFEEKRAAYLNEEGNWLPVKESCPSVTG